MEVSGNKPIWPVFCDEYELTLDEKNRLFLPADVRKDLDSEVHGQFLYLTHDKTGTLLLYPKFVFEEYIRTLPFQILSDPKLEDAARVMLPYTSKVNWDAQGRMVLPPKRLAMSKLLGQRELSLVGKGDHLELWTRQAWAEQSKMDWEKRAVILESWRTVASEVTVKAEP